MTEVMHMQEKAVERAVEAVRNSEMILVGIGSGLERKAENEQAADAFYNKLASFLKGKNYFVITGNTDGKLADGTILSLLCSAPKLEGQGKSWNRYLNWLMGTLNHRLVILELEEGFRDPQFMRWPFEKIAEMNKKAVLVRVHPLLPQIPETLGEGAVGVKAGASEFLEQLMTDEKV